MGDCKKMEEIVNTDTLIHYARQYISEEDIESVSEVLRSDFLTQGPAVLAFEQKLAEVAGSNFAMAVSNATAALHISCLALGVTKGDLVWTSAITFVASANCALYCGADVDFVDISRESYNICADALEAKLIESKRNNRLPKVLIAVHMCGQSPDMKRIKLLSIEYGFGIIEDASHSIGAFYNGAPVGSCVYSDITVFSFHPVKIITTGEGGCVLTNSDKLANKIIRLRSHGITSDKDIFSDQPASEIWNYQQVDLGFNYRITDIQAALGLSQLKKLNAFVGKRREIAAHYDANLSRLPVQLPKEMAGTVSSYHLYPILIDDIDCHNQRAVFGMLREKGVAPNLHYIPVYLQPFYANRGFKRGYCPNAEWYFERTVSIPLHYSLTREQQDYVIMCLDDIFV